MVDLGVQGFNYFSEDDEFLTSEGYRDLERIREDYLKYGVVYLTTNLHDTAFLVERMTGTKQFLELTLRNPHYKKAIKTVYLTPESLICVKKGLILPVSSLVVGQRVSGLIQMAYEIVDIKTVTKPFIKINVFKRKGTGEFIIINDLLIKH